MRAGHLLLAAAAVLLLAGAGVLLDPGEAPPGASERGEGEASGRDRADAALGGPEAAGATGAAAPTRASGSAASRGATEAPGPPGPSGPDWIRGRVVDRQRVTVGGAQVRALRQGEAVAAANTGSDGSFSLVVPPGAIELRVAARGFLPEARGVGLARGIEVEVVLEAARRVEGWVLGLDTGRGVAEATVAARAPGYERLTATEADGRFCFTDAPAVDLDLRVAAQGYVSHRWPEPHGLQVYLDPGRTVRGRLAGAVGPPAEVWVVGARQEGAVQRVEARGSAFAARGIRWDEAFCVVASTEAASSPLRAVWFPPGADGIEVRLYPRATAAVALTDPELDPSQVTLRCTSAPAGLRATFRPAEGRGDLVFEGLPPGTYQLLHGGAALAEGACEVAPAEEPQTLVWRWPPLEAAAGALQAGAGPPDAPAAPRDRPRPLRVRVVDADDRPLAGVPVRWRDAEGAEARVRSDAEGRVVLPPPARGGAVTAASPGRVLRRAPRVGPGVDEVRLVLTRPTRLVGRVVPGEACFLRLRHPEDGLLLREVTVPAGDGRFVLDGLPRGAFDLELRARGRPPLRRRVVLPLEGPLEVALPER